MPDAARFLSFRSSWGRVAALVALVVVGGLAWHLTRGTDKPPPTAAATQTVPSVGVRAAAMRGVSQSFEFVGRVKAIETVDVRARVEGFLEKVLFREGQDVKKGDLLYQIEKVQFAAQVQQAKANLASAQAEATNAELQYHRQLDL
jgi:membrane fusion protein (multidrug efflux system)